MNTNRIQKIDEMLVMNLVEINTRLIQEIMDELRDKNPINPEWVNCLLWIKWAELCMKN